LNYLKEEQYYTNIHDLRTIEDCIHYYHSLHAKMPDESGKSKKYREKCKNDWLRMINMVIHSIKTERYKNKQKWVGEWMEKDRKKQNKLDNTKPGEYYCGDCNVLLDDFDKSLHYSDDEDLKVLFLYKCPKCSKRKGYYDNGQIFECAPTLCEKCKEEIDVSIDIDSKKNITTWVHKCTGCTYKRIDIKDHKKEDKKREAGATRDKKLLDKYRKAFCFTEEEGNKAVQWIESFTHLMKGIKEREDKKKDPSYQKAMSLKKLKVVELRKLLKKVIEKEGYTNLQFEKPEIGRFVAVPFVVQDERNKRDEYDSKKQLKQIINTTLKKTNWRLMSEGIAYRVGYLSGRFRCYETDDEIVNFLKK
jgi:hypothetical protein